MGSITTLLRDQAFGSLKFASFATRSLEIWFSDNHAPTVLDQVLRLEDFSEWIDNHGQYSPPILGPYTAVLRLVYQEWPHDLEIINQDTFPLPEDVYSLMVQKFSLPLGYPYVFARNKQTPIQVNQQFGKDNKNLNIMVQTTCHPEMFTTMTLSFDPKHHVTCGFLGYNRQETSLVDMLLTQALKEASHPLVLPTLFFNMYMTFLEEDTFRQVLSVRHVRKANADLAAPGRHVNIFKEFTEANSKIIKAYDILSTSITPFTTALGQNLGEAFEKVEAATRNTQMLGSTSRLDNERMKNSGRALKTVWEELEVTREGLIDSRQRSLQRLEMQRQVLYNLMQRHDGKLSQDIAIYSKRIAMASKLDGSAMKSIAAVTMAFLPGTAIAAILSMSSFFDISLDGTMHVSGYFWIYWALTIPVTLFVFVTWWLWNTFERKNVRLMESNQDVELDSLQSLSS